MRFTITTILLMVLALPACADRLTLIYGDILEGQIIQETDTTVTIRGPYGEQKFSKQDIQEIQRDTAGSPAQQPVASEPEQVSPPPPVVPPSASAPPEPYELLKRNVEIQSSWKDLEIAYLQRAYVGGQTVQTQFIGRVIPPNYFRSKLTTPIPASAQFPQGGEVEYDMYRAKGTLYQAVKAPGQPIQYLKLDMNRIDGLSPGDNPVESYKAGFVGAGTDENLLAAVARNTRVIGSENTDGHDCWVMETINSPDLVEAQIARQPPELQPNLRQQLAQLGYVRSWVGKEDTIQWRMENYDSQGNLLLSMKMISVKPNQGLTVQNLRMKVPKGTEFIDVTEMVAGQFNQLIGGPPGIVPIPSPNEMMGGGMSAQPYQGTAPVPGMLPQTAPQQAVPPGAWPTAPQSYPAPPPRQPSQQQVNSYPAQPAQPAMLFVPQQQQQALQQQAQVYSYPQYSGRQPAPVPQYMPPTASQAPVSGYPQNPPVYQVPQQAQVYQPQPQYIPPQGYQQGPQAFQQTYVQQPPGFQPQPQQRSGGIGGFFQRLFGGGGSSGAPQGGSFGGYSQSGNATVMVPMVGGQPQFPTPPR